MPDIITMPASLYDISQSRFNITTKNTISDASPFNPTPNVDGPSYARWLARLTFNPVDGDGLDDLDEFITQLKGGLVLCRLYDLRKAGGPQGAGGVTTTVNVAADVLAGATSVTIKSLVVSQAVAFKKMDQIGVGENLHRIVHSGPSDASGQGTFEIWPPTRHGWAVDDPVETVNPTGLFRIIDGQDDLTITPPMISDSLTLSFIEVPNFDA